MTRISFGIVAILFSCFHIAIAQAPHWQWAKRAGSSNFSGMGGVDEMVMDMATDVHGNLYVLSNVLTPGADADGHATTGYGGYDIMISSFRCDGTYRWTKIMGSNIQDDRGRSIKTDTLGGVYVIGTIDANATQLHIDADSVWVGGPRKDVFIAKFDTAGTYKWFRMPQADSSTVASLLYEHAFYDMDVDGAGNIFVLSLLAPGAYSGGSFVVPAHGFYLLRYDRNGIFQSNVPLNISFTTSLGGPMFLMGRDQRGGRFYITGTTWGNVTIGATPIVHNIFVSCFGPTGGAPLWTRQNSAAGGWGVCFTRPAVDHSGAVYLCGATIDNDTFNSYVLTNPASIDNTPFVVKMDSNGSNIWARNASCIYDCGGSYISVAGNEVVTSGNYTGWFTWPGITDTLRPPVGPGGYRLYYSRFNATTGAALALDSIGTVDGAYNEPTVVTHDNFGNFYTGGDFAVSIWLPGDTIDYVGGGSDCYIAKYGTANCSTPPSLGSSAIAAPANTVQAFPNPVFNELMVTSRVAATYRLTAVTGAIIQQGTLRVGENSLRLSGCPPGLYLLEVFSEDGSRNVFKLAKE